MARLACVVPGPWQPLLAALWAAGHEAWHCGLPAGPRPSGVPWWAIDLAKAVAAVAPDAGWPEVQRHLEALTGSREAGQRLHATLRQLQPQAIVTTCTYDLPGMAAVAAGKELGVPVVHVQHACAAFVPEEAWFCAAAPGDLVLVPGARDRAWWQRCQPAARVLVTGHALWDGYYGRARRPRRPQDPPVVLWACESGANAAVTPRYWASRAVPGQAWQAFLAAAAQLGPRARVVCKLRAGEDAAMVARWEREAAAALPPDRHGFTDAPAAEVLPLVNLVLVEQSNLGVEALHLGLPVGAIAREGELLFEPAHSPVVPVLPPEAPALTAALGGLLQGDGPSEAACREVAAHYNRGAGDGQAMARVVAAIGRAATGEAVTD